MSEKERLWRDIRSDEDAERALTELGQVVHRKEQVEAEGLNSAYRDSLRARLVATATKRGRTAGGPGIPAWTVRRHQWPAWAATAVALAALLIVALVLHGHGAGTRPVAVATPGTPALHPPPPAVADLLRAAPPSFQGQSGGLPIPELSGSDVQAGAYGGHLTLSAGHLPVEPAFLPAYRLAGPSFDVPRVAVLARQLGIDRPVVPRTNSIDHQIWEVAAQGGPGSNQPLHSLAISRHTGELIYHHAPNIPASHPAPALNRTRAVSFAHRWITALGWPARMPVLSTVPDTQLLPPSAGIPWQVSFGWRGVARPAETQATVIVLPDGHVIEARLWPPIRRSGHVVTRDVQTAWRMVQTGAVPIAVQEMGAMRVTGAGSLQRADVVQALETRGTVPYLVPMYRFQGTVRITGLGEHKWSALVPAMRLHP